MGGCVVVGCVSLGFFQLQKGEINEKGRGVGGGGVSVSGAT